MRSVPWQYVSLHIRYKVRVDEHVGRRNLVFVFLNEGGYLTKESASEEEDLLVHDLQRHGLKLSEWRR